MSLKDNTSQMRRQANKNSLASMLLFPCSATKTICLCPVNGLAMNNTLRYILLPCWRHNSYPDVVKPQRDIVPIILTQSFTRNESQCSSTTVSSLVLLVGTMSSRTYNDNRPHKKVGLIDWFNIVL